MNFVYLSITEVFFYVFECYILILSVLNKIYEHFI